MEVEVAGCASFEIFTKEVLTKLESTVGGFVPPSTSLKLGSDGEVSQPSLILRGKMKATG